MLFLTLMASIIMIIILILLLANFFISKKSFLDREKLSSYECGFDPLNASKESFSIQFFLISVMFLTFDIEIIILIPLTPSIKMFTIKWIFSASVVVLTLILGLYIEWMESSINWQNI